MTLSDLWPAFQGHIFLKSIVWKLSCATVTLFPWFLGITVTIAHLQETISNISKGTMLRPWLTSKRVARVCQHQLSFLSHILPPYILYLVAFHHNFPTWVWRYIHTHYILPGINHFLHNHRPHWSARLYSFPEPMQRLSFHFASILCINSWMKLFSCKY